MEPFGVQKRVCGEIDRMKEEMVRTLQKLVRIPSVVGHEEEAQKFMEKLYRSLGLKESGLWKGPGRGGGDHHRELCQ